MGDTGTLKDTGALRDMETLKDTGTLRDKQQLKWMLNKCQVFVYNTTN